MWTGHNLATAYPDQPHTARPVVDGLIRAEMLTVAVVESVLRQLDLHGISFALLLGETPQQFDADLEAARRSGEGRILCAPCLDVNDPTARQDFCKAGEAWSAVSLSSLGAFRSPMRAFEPDLAESAEVWRAAGKRRQRLIVWPSVADAGLLLPLTARFADTRVAVRGGLISRMNGRAAIAGRALPTPDRFTFDRLHQLPNAHLILSPQASREALNSETEPVGWHSPSNLLALFSAARIIWGSGHRLSEGPYPGMTDPGAAFGDLSRAERTALIGGTARCLFS